MKLINTTGSKEPNGHYSQASMIGNTLYVSAQLPEPILSPRHNDIEQEVGRQTRSVLTNILAITQAAGGTLNDIALVRFYSTDIKYWPMIDRAFADFMGDHLPARAVICIAAIKQDFLVMAEAISEIPLSTIKD
ncbi:RidA family protein [Vibrio algivorus]|uniref:Reactive intermediate/imine deaminase n=1 Tax=Vibrio algivorus TaxID=1667024 RepID=A0ABQ6ELD3_9VIBR|nr:RidA family protein [Vibrio algivorus]GLT13806.1 reactive intermediate/imine deaminase [Vibrio algivorus]